MFLFALVLGVLFFQKADTLNCYECPPGLNGNCTLKTTECPPQNYQCGAARSIAFQGGKKIVDVKTKGCVMPEQCFEGSVNTGDTRWVQKMTCCTTNLCNIQTPEYNSIPNGKKCFSCEGQSCTSTVKCEVDENYCIKATVNTGGISHTVKGCASKVMCSAKITLPLEQLTGVQFSCCQGDYCNSASTASPILLLLLVPLLFSVLFA